jgi:hypothetical protein
MFRKKSDEWKLLRMETIKLDQSDFKPSVSYWRDYIGQHDVSDLRANIEIGQNLGYVAFPMLRCAGSVQVRSGSGLIIRDELLVDSFVSADWNIQVGGRIAVGGDLSAGWALIGGDTIDVRGKIKAGTSIKAGGTLRAGRGIEAGAGIKSDSKIFSGGSIAAGEGVEAGLSIECRDTLEAGLRILAGLSLWKEPADEEKKISCARLIRGTVALGRLEERGA